MAEIAPTLDRPMRALLPMIASTEAIILSTFVLVSQNGLVRAMAERT